VRQVVYALTGSESSPPILDRLLERFVQRVRDDLEDTIWGAQFRQSGLAEPLFKAYRDLSDQARLRFCLNPMLFDALSAASKDSSDSRFEAILTVIKGRQADDLESREEFLLGGTIVVDVGTSACRRVDPTSPVFMQPLDPLSDEEKGCVTSKLTAAMAEIDETAPAFARMIRNYTRRIFIRKIPAHVPASEQVDTELGAIRLRNVHSDLYSHDQLVDDLIHESTHNFLGVFEYLEFPFNPFGLRPESWIRPVSPWSMRSIQSLPFVHACFVYFAMYHYCELRRRSGLPDDSQVLRLKARQHRYASGFLMPGRLSECASSLGFVDSRVCQAMDWMESIMQDYYQIRQRPEAVQGERALEASAA